ncbi:hypothetical protein PHLCEN_2v3682 [Hermanssonia centrifuga]|uniref:Uncharacterized protein n=1 Tax=Hermanssonia centrifuga TaxID=98765 RepID=A0A2R6QEE7_9APHY|nr:hypothetical protein PHLCEN_2v3682 [Hermanssonia centrifuga]
MAQNIMLEEKNTAVSYTSPLSKSVWWVTLNINVRTIQLFLHFVGSTTAATAERYEQRSADMSYPMTEKKKCATTYASCWSICHWSRWKIDLLFGAMQ